MQCDGGKGCSTTSDDSTKRRLRCPIAPIILDLAVPRDAQFVMASLVSSGTTRGEPRSVPRSASIASELAGKVTAIGWAGSKSPSTAAREPREGFMTVQISQRGKEYLETAQTLLRAAKTMTDSAIAGQLKALADDYQRRAEKASHVDSDG